MLFTTPSAVKTFALIAIAAALSGCGAGSVKDPYIPSSYTAAPAFATSTTASVIVFGDSMSDLTTNAQYTVNDASVNNWTIQVASSYGIPAIGIKSYAIGNALVADIATQVTSAGSIYGRDPLVLISGGLRDIINAAETPGITSAAAVAAATAAGTAYANVARSAVSAGAKHVLIMNLYNLGATPYQTLGGRTAATHPLNLMIRAFNDAMKTNLGDPTKTYVGDTIRLGNAEQAMSSIFSAATLDMVCSTTPADLGITGISFSAKGCTTSTMTAPATSTTYDNYVFADPIHLTPAQQRNLGTGMRAFATW
jgi:outer membrane lipase/esterase